jgi:hypothetical protein
MSDFPVIFKILSKLQKEKTSDWIDNIEKEDIVPFMIVKWLSMNHRFIPYANILNKSLHLEPKQFLLYAWSIIPKSESAIRLTYIKKQEDEDVVENVVYNKIRKVLQLSDNDWQKSKKYFIKDVKDNKVEYFKSFGIEKKNWKKAGLDFEDIKVGEIREGKKGLELFGI